MRLVWGRVVRVVSEDESVQRLDVVADGDSAVASAVAYPPLCGACVPDDRVLLNTSAVDRGLGTGGEHFVVARAGEGLSLERAVPGHIMKLRYTPLQHEVTAVEEPASGHHHVMSEALSLHGMPVVCCGLHSQVPLVAAAVKERRPGARVVYVMTDEAALPMAVSRLVPAMVAAGLVDATITCGQAFGGEFEAVNLYSALLAARHVARADVTVVAVGPGLPGTGTPYGHAGVAQGVAINAVAALDGVPVAALRASFADPRSRHVPISHQTLTALGAVALASAHVAVPELPGSEARALDEALVQGGVWPRHVRHVVPAGALPDLRGVDVRTMNRGPAEDPAFFAAAAAAGALGADLLPGGDAGRQKRPRHDRPGR